MARPGIRVEGVGDVQAALAKLGAGIIEAVEQALDDEADETARDAAGRARRDTGDLAGSIAGERDGLTATVAPRPERSRESAKRLVLKALVNEYGRSRDPGRSFMVPASELARGRWPKRARAAVEQAAKR